MRIEELNLRRYSLAKPIADKTIENQGCSMNLNGHEPVKGYMVGLKGTEQKELLLDFNENHIDSFIRVNLRLLNNRKVYIGTWINGDIVVIDCSMNLQNKRAALAFAQDNGQICIWDVLNKKEIYQLEETTNG